MSVFGVFLVCIFLHSDSIWRDTVQMQESKDRKTPYTNTFHALWVAVLDRGLAHPSLIWECPMFNLTLVQNNSGRSKTHWV